jgi:hypothetical protein
VKDGNLLPSNKARALRALMEYPSIQEAAKAARVGQRSIVRWLAKDEAFKRELAEAQKRALDQTIARLSGAGPLAADVLAQIATDDEVPASVRVQAASRILSEQRVGMNLSVLKNEIDDLRRIVDEFEKRD